MMGWQGWVKVEAPKSLGDGRASETIGLVSFPGRLSKTNFCLLMQQNGGGKEKRRWGFLVSAVEY